MDSIDPHRSVLSSSSALSDANLLMMAEEAIQTRTDQEQEEVCMAWQNKNKHVQRKAKIQDYYVILSTPKEIVNEIFLFNPPVFVA